jgi:hypothetical protein
VRGRLGLRQAAPAAHPWAAKAKAEEAKAKAAEATKKARADEEKAMDRVAERYKREKGVKTASAPKKQ